MRNATIRSQIDAINSLFGYTASLSSISPELQSHWAKYICILAAGLIENAYKALYGEYMRNNSNPAIASFARSHLNRMQNPKLDKFLRTSGTLNSQWKDDLRSFLGSKLNSHGIDSIMSNRHRIAHGEQSDITIIRVKEYFEESVRFLEFIENQLA